MSILWNDIFNQFLEVEDFMKYKGTKFYEITLIINYAKKIVGDKYIIKYRNLQEPLEKFINELHPVQKKFNDYI